jgi:hypothetical protein
MPDLCSSLPRGRRSALPNIFGERYHRAALRGDLGGHPAQFDGQGPETIAAPGAVAGLASLLQRGGDTPDRGRADRLRGAFQAMRGSGGARRDRPSAKPASVSQLVNCREAVSSKRAALPPWANRLASSGWVHQTSDQEVTDLRIHHQPHLR